MNELNNLCNQVLRDNLPEGLKKEIDRMLARGVSKAGLLDIIGRMARRAGKRTPAEGAMGELTIAAVEAYLATK